MQKRGERKREREIVREREGGEREASVCVRERESGGKEKLDGEKGEEKEQIDQHQGKRSRPCVQPLDVRTD